MINDETARLVVAILAGLAWVGTASAQAPAGLVLETSGTITPAAKPYTEIAGGTTLTLSGGARLVSPTTKRVRPSRSSGER